MTETADWTPGTIVRAHPPERPIPPVEGWVKGSFGVFLDAAPKSWRDGLWNLTHVPSGCRLGFYDEQHDAFKTADQLAALPVDWASVNASYGVKGIPADLVGAMRAIVTAKRSTRQ